jgi:hypothetical protein
MPKYHIEWMEEYVGILYELRIVDDKSSSGTWFTLKDLNYSTGSWGVIFSAKIQIPEDVKGEFISEVLSRGLSYFADSDFDKLFAEFGVTVCE